jgi:hypothetical protein
MRNWLHQLSVLDKSCSCLFVKVEEAYRMSFTHYGFLDEQLPR